MKIHSKIALTIGVVLPLLGAAPLAALETNGSTAQETQTTTTTEKQTTTKTDAEKAAELRARVEAKKAALKTKLQVAEQTRIKGKCKAAQTVVGTVEKRIGNVSANHTKAFEKIDQRVGTLLTKLEAKDGVDTTDLKQKQATLQAKIATYKADLVAHEQTLQDMAAIDCVTDPTAFKAMLESARSTRAKLSASASDIRLYVNQILKPALTALRQTLAQQAKAQGSN